MIKRIPNIFTRLITSTLPFTSFPKYLCSEYTIHPNLQHFAEISIRQHRRLFLNKAVLSQTKDVVFAKKRETTDTILGLRQEGKCPGVIELFGGDVSNEIDVVVDGKKMRALVKTGDFPLKEIYVRVEGKEYRCIYYKVESNPDGFIQKVFFKEYVAGEPNELTVPIELTQVANNPHVMDKGEIDQKYEEINIICYNEEYPTKFYIDISYASPDRPYRVGDLANTLTPGILINPKVNLNDKIAKIIEEEKKSKSLRQEAIQELIDKNKKSKENKGAPPAGGTASTPAGQSATPAATKAPDTKGKK